ncbi:peptidyl-prolyl cis-trans isomerase [Clostridium tarantellae]|uniref:PpiC domain-containing protein n=1 Tax=Clostridium tarantellae TaxID=39493 RepID=A0A6I1MKB1_9CLOT|nr:peptidyl-prolyl cis-trans isomerase [Clostridium tarantellae]MPQ43153.1 hypothetical protein [Clostridium tarantellae]
MKKYKIFVVITLIILLSSVIGMGINVFSKEEDKFDVVFYVNEEPVYLGEFMLYFNKNKTKVFKEFSHEKSGKEFWNTKILEGETPLDLVKILTIEDLKEIKTIQITAKKFKVIENIDYKSFTKELKEENKRREKAINNGEVIYGPKQYKEEEYFSYLLENIKNKLKKAIESNNNISEEEIKKYYEENKETLYKIEDKVDVNIISIPYVDSQGMVDEKSKTLTFERIKEIRSKLQETENMDFEDNSNIKTNFYEFKKDNKRNDNKFLAEFKEEALKLKPKEFSNIIDFNGAYNFMICDKRDGQGYKSLDEVKSEIKEELITDIYRLQLKLINSNCKIKVNDKVFNSIK